METLCFSTMQVLELEQNDEYINNVSSITVIEYYISSRSLEKK